MKKSKIALGLFLVSIVVAPYLTLSVKGNADLDTDRSIANFITMIFPEQTIAFFKVIEIFGEELGIAIVGIPIIIWLALKKRNYFGALTILIAVAVGNEVSKLIKNFIQRPRPRLEHFSDAEGFGFPSGHAMVGATLYIVVAYFIFKELQRSSLKWLVGLLFLFMMGLVGASRIVLQVHYATDVISGFAFAYIWSYLIIIGYEGVIGRRKLSSSQSFSKNM